MIPQNQQLPAGQAGKLSAKKIQALPPQQRVWSDNVLRALKLKSKGSQARVLAGAIATTEQLAQGPDAATARTLLATVRKAGDPPWKDAAKAMAATDAKMQLDLLSIPAQNRQLTPLGNAAGNINAAFLVKRVDADGQTRNSFLCKPANIKDDDDPETVDGVPNGGEVIREALAGRAAQTFASQTGLDIGMPESHVVSLAPNMLPAGARPADGGNATCSVQEFRPGQRALKECTPQQKAAIPRDQVAALAVFDLMTLNTDRHSGNIMSDGNGGMLPIDHGASFVQGDAGRQRIADSLCGPHNALLKLPAAFEPMSPAVLKKVKAIKSSDYRASLEKDRDLVAGAHPDMGGMISDEALDWAAKAARFAKLAARNKPPLSPGGMQVAFGANAGALLAAQDFDAQAKQVIARAIAHADSIKGVCLADDVENADLVRKLRALGWQVQERGQPPNVGAVADPVLMLAIIDRNIAKGNNAAAALNQARTPPPDPAAMKARLLELRLGMIRQMIALTNQAERAAQTTALNTLAGTVDQKMAASLPLLEAVRTRALAVQQARLDAKLAAGASRTAYQIANAVAGATRRDPIEMDINLSLLP